MVRPPPFFATVLNASSPPSNAPPHEHPYITAGGAEAFHLAESRSHSHHAGRMGGSDTANDLWFAYTQTKESAELIVNALASHAQSQARIASLEGENAGLRDTLTKTLHSLAVCARVNDGTDCGDKAMREYNNVRQFLATLNQAEGV
jgi:hypothetical protein